MRTIGAAIAFARSRASRTRARSRRGAALTRSVRGGRGFDARDATLVARFDRVDRSIDRSIGRSVDRSRAARRFGRAAARDATRDATARARRREDDDAGRPRIERGREASTRSLGAAASFGLDWNWIWIFASSDRRGGDTRDRELGSARGEARDR